MNAAISQCGVAIFRRSVSQGTVRCLFVGQYTWEDEGQVSVLVKGAFGNEGDAVVSSGLFHCLVRLFDNGSQFRGFNGFDRHSAGGWIALARRLCFVFDFGGCRFCSGGWCTTALLPIHPLVQPSFGGPSWYLVGG